MITRENYEIYAIDYLEGKLNQQDKHSFEEFLRKNPDIAQEIFDLSLTPIKQDKISFPDKLNLKKSSIDGLSYFDELCITEIEGLTTKKQKTELKKFIAQDPEKEKIFLQYQLTKLSAQSISYPYKAELRKSIFQNYITAISHFAAIFLLIFSLISLWKSQLNNKPTHNNLVYSIEIALPPSDPIFFDFYREPVSRSAHTSITQNTNKQTTNSQTTDIPNNFSSDTIQSSLIINKEFTITQAINDSIKLKPEKIAFNKTQNDMLNLLTERALKTFKYKTEKKGIIIRKDELKFTINDKTYGICWR